MIKELIKMAGELDRLGLKREADLTDGIIRKLSARNQEKKEQFQECECTLCGARMIDKLDGRCICGECKPGYLMESIEDLEDKIERALRNPAKGHNLLRDQEKLERLKSELESLGESDFADDGLIRVASSNRTPEQLIELYKSPRGQERWIGKNESNDFYRLADDSPDMKEAKLLHYDDWNTDDFKKVILAVDGIDKFEEYFGKLEAERMGDLLSYVELEPGIILKQEQILKLLAGHFDKGNSYTMSKSLLDKITSVGLTTSDLEEVDMRYLRYSA